MRIEETFDKEINYCLTNNYNSPINKILDKLKSMYPNKVSYYSMFDDLNVKLGIDMSTKEIYNAKNGHTKGFIPIIHFYKKNKLNEAPRNIELVSIKTPMSLLNCYKLLAKKMIYLLANVSNLDSLIE